MKEEVLYRGIRDEKGTDHLYRVEGAEQIELSDSHQSGRAVSWGYRGTGPLNLVNLLVNDYYRDDPNAQEKETIARQVFRRLTDEISEETVRWDLTRRDIEYALTDAPLEPTYDEVLAESRETREAAVATPQ